MLAYYVIENSIVEIEGSIKDDKFYVMHINDKYAYMKGQLIDRFYVVKDSAFNRAEDWCRKTIKDAEYQIGNRKNVSAIDLEYFDSIIKETRKKLEGIVERTVYAYFAIERKW